MKGTKFKVTGFEPVVAYGGELYTVYTEKRTGKKTGVSRDGKTVEMATLMRDVRRFIDAGRRSVANAAR